MTTSDLDAVSEAGDSLGTTDNTVDQDFEDSRHLTSTEAPKSFAERCQQLTRQAASVLLRPQFLIIAFLGTSAVYCFGIGRPRYQTTSEFVIRQPSASAAISTSIFAPSLASPTVQGSLEDGRFLQVYLGSPEVLMRLYPNPSRLQELYAPTAPDLWSGLRSTANRDEQLSFFQRQIHVLPQELSGSVQLTTVGYTPQQALALNSLLLKQAQRFVNEVNQSISDNQRRFAESEVVKARVRLQRANTALNQFEDRSRQLNPVQERDATSTFISALEAKLVDLKVQESALRRQFRDPQAPEVATLSDQVVELEQQIKDERRKVVSPTGRNLNRLSTQVQNLQNEVIFATEALKAAMLTADNRRIESERQLKYLVMLRQAELPAQPEDSWRWRAFLATVGVVLVAWGVGGFLVGVVRRS